MLRTMMIGIILMSCGIVEPGSGIETMDSNQRIEKIDPIVMPPHPRTLLTSIRTEEDKVGSQYILTAYLHSPIKRTIIVAFVDNDREGMIRPRETGTRRTIATQRLLISGDAEVKIKVSEIPKNWGIIIWE